MHICSTNSIFQKFYQNDLRFLKGAYQDVLMNHGKVHTFIFPQANDETRQQTHEYEETKKQIEEDADREILDIKNKYERRLRDEKEANMRLKGETGIMKKKVMGWLN